MLKINLKISSGVLSKTFNLSLSGPAVRQQMIFKKKSWNVKSDLVHTQLDQLLFCIHVIYFTLNFPTDRMKVIFLTSVAKGGFREADRAKQKSKCGGFGRSITAPGQAPGTCKQNPQRRTSPHLNSQRTVYYESASQALECYLRAAGSRARSVWGVAASHETLEAWFSRNVSEVIYFGTTLKSSLKK